VNQPVNQAVNHDRFEVADGDRLRWQRQAAHALTAVLQNAPVLPPLIWTIGPTGALVGHLAGLIPAERLRERFQAWVAALELSERPPVSSPGGAVWHLAAEAMRGQVRLRVTASVLAAPPEEDDLLDGQISKSGEEPA
jgi:hypothetical protein